jgi:hypothetical protein
MGKKTDALLKSVSDKSDACLRTAGALINHFGEWKKIQDEWDKWEDELARDLKWETNHPYGKRRIAAWQKGIDLRVKLKGEVNDLNKVLGEFRAFLAKKEKSKNPFKSKTSLPGAKAMLKSYEPVVSEFDQILSMSGKLFR